MTVVTRFSLHLAEDYPVLVPLALRFHPEGAVELHEWGDEKDPGIALYVGTRKLRLGEELTVAAPDDSNLELVVHGGYVWNDERASRPKLQLKGRDESRHAADHPGEKVRAQLLSSANWSYAMEFELGSTELKCAAHCLEPPAARPRPAPPPDLRAERPVERGPPSHAAPT